MKTLMALPVAVALMLAMLAIGNTAGAGPFGVSMGDTIKPDKGWAANGHGVKSREYKGELGFDRVFVEGTREGGACAVGAWVNFDDGTSDYESIKEDASLRYKSSRSRLLGKYGKPFWEERYEVRWVPYENTDKIHSITIWNTGGMIILKYFFENNHQCEKAKESAP